MERNEILFLYSLLNINLSCCFKLQFQKISLSLTLLTKYCETINIYSLFQYAIMCCNINSGTAHKLPEFFEIHMTSKFKYDKLSGRNATENDYNVGYCPFSFINTCNHYSCSRNHNNIFFISFLIS